VLTRQREKIPAWTAVTRSGIKERKAQNKEKTFTRLRDGQKNCLIGLSKGNVIKGAPIKGTIRQLFYQRTHTEVEGLERVRTRLSTVKQHGNTRRSIKSGIGDAKDQEGPLSGKKGL